MDGNSKSIVDRHLHEDEMLTVKVTRSEAREIQELIYGMVCRKESELQGIRANNAYTMPKQLMKMSATDRKFQIDPWCSLVMRWRKMSEVFVEAIGDE